MSFLVTWVLIWIFFPEFLMLAAYLCFLPEVPRGNVLPGLLGATVPLVFIAVCTMLYAGVSFVLLLVVRMLVCLQRGDQSSTE